MGRTRAAASPRASRYEQHGPGGLHQERPVLGLYAKSRRALRIAPGASLSGNVSRDWKQFPIDWKCFRSFFQSLSPEQTDLELSSVIVASYASKNRPRPEWTDRAFGGQLCRFGGLSPDTYCTVCGHCLTCGGPCALRNRTEGQTNSNRRSSVSEDGHARTLPCVLPSIEYKTKNRTSLEARFLLTRNGHATFCADVFYMKIKKIVKPLHAGAIIRGARFI